VKTGRRVAAPLIGLLAQLRAARDGVDADLAAAIGFFRQVGASAYVAGAGSLVATSRSA
jgi:hypothetical protein